MGAQSAAALKLFFETGDKPTQSEFADFIDSYANLIDNNLLNGREENITAVDPPTQGTAFALTKALNIISLPSGADGGVLLPVALAGRVCTVVNSTDNIQSVFPQSGENITNYANDISRVIEIDELQSYVCIAAGTWILKSNQPSGGGVRGYSARIFQSGGGAPSPTIITNSLGGVPVWTRTGTGEIRLTLAGFFKAQRMNVTVTVFGGGAAFRIDVANMTSDDFIEFQGFTTAGAASDGLQFYLYIEVLS